VLDELRAEILGCQLGPRKMTRHRQERRAMVASTKMVS